MFDQEARLQRVPAQFWAVATRAGLQQHGPLSPSPRAYLHSSWAHYSQFRGQLQVAKEAGEVQLPETEDQIEIARVHVEKS